LHRWSINEADYQSKNGVIRFACRTVRAVRHLPDPIQFFPQKR
jgi:hypothetical protein